MIDLHAHILPAIDDGPATLEQAVALCQRMADAGTTAVAATSHVSPRYDNRAATLAASRTELQAAIDARGIELGVHRGAEIAAEHFNLLEVEELADLRLGAGNHILLECPLSPYAGDLAPVVASARRRGHRVLLAHPERCPEFQRDARPLRDLVVEGALCCVTAGSFFGRFGKPAQRLARALAAEGLVHNLASDAHDLVRRAPDLRGDVAQAVRKAPALSGRVRWLTEDVPRAVLEGDPIPNVPAVGAPRGTLRPWRRGTS